MHFAFVCNSLPNIKLGDRLSSGWRYISKFIYLSIYIFIYLCIKLLYAGGGGCIPPHRLPRDPPLTPVNTELVVLTACGAGCEQISRLDAAMLSPLLVKSSVVWYRRRRQSVSRADVEVLSTLMSVCRYWRQLVSRLHCQLTPLVVEGASVCLSVCLSVCPSVCQGQSRP